MKNTQFWTIHEIKDPEICVAGIQVICGKLLNDKWNIINSYIWQSFPHRFIVIEIIYYINSNLLKFNTIIMLWHQWKF